MKLISSSLSELSSSVSDFFLRRENFSSPLSLLESDMGSSG